MVQVLEYGATKYAPDNWKKGLNREEILESLLRHVFELMDQVDRGESDLDSESGLEHIGHIMCNAMFYSYHKRNNSFAVERNDPFTK